jgi:hypothetical protein
MSKLESGPSSVFSDYCTGGGCYYIEETRDGGAVVYNASAYNGYAAYKIGVEIAPDNWKNGNLGTESLSPEERRSRIGDLMLNGAVRDMASGEIIQGADATDFFSEPDHLAAAAELSDGLYERVRTLPGVLIDSSPYQS